VDVVREGFDCVLRVGTLADSELVVRPLGVLPMCNVASPAYLRAHGTPRTLADLAQHRIVHYAARLGTQGAGWEYEEGGARRLLAMKAAVVVNSTDAYQAACLAGLGLIQAPLRGTRALVRAGVLVEVLPEYTAPAMPISLLYPHRRHVPPRVQAMLQWMEQLVRAELEDTATGRAASAPGKRAPAREARLASR
jgi:DNA-binding transcriptional LysR family regulator